MRDRPCVVVGGGAVAERKATTLLEAGAEVTVISPTITRKLLELSASGKISHLPKKYAIQDLSGAFLVIAATDSAEVNTRVARDCRAKQLLVNAATPPEESNFIVPSVVERGDLVISVSTSGASPALAKKIRRELEGHYGAEYAVFLEKLSQVRERVLDELSDETERRRIFQAIVDSEVIGLIGQGKIDEAEARMAELAGVKRRS